MEAQRYNEGIFYYTAALSLLPSSPQIILVQRSRAFVASGLVREALDDANQVRHVYFRKSTMLTYLQAIELDPLSPWGYEVKHAALHEAGEYDGAVASLKEMFSKITDSSNPEIQRESFPRHYDKDDIFTLLLGHRDQYIDPSSTEETIRDIVKRTIRRLPRVLINTTNGLFHDRNKLASTFESSPIFNKLVSSVTTHTYRSRIKREVRQYFRYVMLSHKWGKNEPTFREVVDKVVYDLEESPGHDKLRMFCEVVQKAKFHWAWSDTCCVDKSDRSVLEEALVAMFRWYQRAALVIVFLCGVRSSSPRGALARSIWNTRGWTLQEYIAAKAIRFYTEDWTPYLNLQLPNHKEAPDVISEMHEVTGASAQQLLALRPGFTNIREKLRLASTRETDQEEDIAYSLLGIFSITGFTPIYGEGEEVSLGRLLASVLTCSRDATILAWTGKSGSFNSCLPARITVFKKLATPHLPAPTPDIDPPLDANAALSLYDHLLRLPPPRFVDNLKRLELPCIAFQLPGLRSRPGCYYADTVAFGKVKIKTKQDLSQVTPLYLVHPWLSTLLGHDDLGMTDAGGAFVEGDTALPSHANTDDDELSDEEVSDGEVDEEEEDDDSTPLSEPESPFRSAPAHMAPVPVDREIGARRLVARLRQPFGALLLTLSREGRRGVDYTRVATDSMITVQFRENISLTEIRDNVRMFDVL